MDTLKDAIRLKKGATLYFPKGGIRGDYVLLLTPAQINRLDKEEVEGRRAQVAKKVSTTGGFLGMLASLVARAILLAARALPTILSGLATGLLSGDINKAISDSGDGLYLHKHDKCYRVQKGNGLYLGPHPRFVEGGGLFLKLGNDISDGAGLLMGKNSPFKNIPVLGWLL